MDQLQIILSILIPLGVSVLVWTLTYIIPYIRPNWLSDSVLEVTMNDPKHPVEIGLIINQFSKYDDWKRLTACKRMKRMFIHKIREIEANEELKWVKLKNKTIYMPLKRILDSIDVMLSILKDDKYEEKHNLKFTSKDVKSHFNKKKDLLKENQAKYSEILKDYPNTIIWGKCYMSPEYIEKYNKGGYYLTPREIELLDPQYTILDQDASMTKKEFLESTGHETPKRQSDEEIIAKFNEFILYIDYPHPKKDELTYRLVMGLSNHEKSSEILNELINEMESQILSKDYKEWKTRFNLW